jgi:hypothetical protein
MVVEPDKLEEYPTDWSLANQMHGLVDDAVEWLLLD